MIQFLRGTSSQLQSSNQVFAAGQPIFESDSGQLKIGNGTSTFANLPYVGASDANSITVSGNHTNGSIEFNDSKQTSLSWNQSLIMLSGVHFTASGSIYISDDIDITDYLNYSGDIPLGIWGSLSSSNDAWISELGWSLSNNGGIYALNSVSLCLCSGKSSVSNNRVNLRLYFLHCKS